MSKKNEISIVDVFQRLTDTLGCHRIPERSFKLKNKTMPLCSRCFGGLLGQTFAALLLCLGIRITWFASLLLLLPMAIDGGLQEYMGIMSNNVRRFITGFLGGVGLTYLYIFAILSIWHWAWIWYSRV